MQVLRRTLPMTAVLLLAAQSAVAEISIVNTNAFIANGNYPITALSSFDPGSASKLVATISTEYGFGDEAVGGVSYDGATMTLAVTQANSIQNVYIYYLDASEVGGSFSVGDLVVTGSGNNDLGGSLIALAGTTDGIDIFDGAASQTVDLTTVVDGSCVVAAQANNNAGAPAQAPLIQMLNGDVGSCGGGSGYAIIATAGAGTYGFTGSSRPATVAVAIAPAGASATLAWHPDVSASLITATSASLSATLLGLAADVTAYWDAGTVSDPATHTGWDGSDGPSAETVGSVVRAASSLTADTHYSFAFYGTNSTENSSAWSSVGTFDSALTDAQTPVFTNVTVDGLKVTLSWQDNAATETGYVLSRSANGVDFSPIGSLPADTVLYVDSLSVAGDYTYHLTATNTVNASGTDPSLCQTNATATTPDYGIVQLVQVTDELDAATWVYPLQIAAERTILVVGFYADGTTFDNIRFGDGGGIGSGDVAADGVIQDSRAALAYFINPSTASGLAIRGEIPGDGCLGAWVLAGMDLNGTVITSTSDAITTTEDEMFIVSWASANGEVTMSPNAGSDIDLPIDITSKYAGGGTGSGAGGSTLAATAGSYGVGWNNDGYGPLGMAFEKAPPPPGTLVVVE